MLEELLDVDASSENCSLWRSRVDPAPLLTFVLSDGEASEAGAALAAAAAAAAADCCVCLLDGWLWRGCARVASRRLRRQPGRHARHLLPPGQLLLSRK